MVVGIMGFAAFIGLMILGATLPPAALTAEQYDAYAASANAALTDFVAVGVRSPELTDRQLADSLRRAADSYHASLDKLAAASSPPSRLTVHRIAFPVFQEIGQTLDAIVSAAEVGDHIAVEREWSYLTALLYDAQRLSVIGNKVEALARSSVDSTSFHATFARQSPYPTLSPGEITTLVVAFHNTGSRGWSRVQEGEVAILGTSNPLGGTYPDFAYHWLAADRLAFLTTDYVAPGQDGWFQFSVRAPETPGTYRLDVRPLIDGVGWLEDPGVYWLITVR